MVHFLQGGVLNYIKQVFYKDTHNGFFTLKTRLFKY